MNAVRVPYQPTRPLIGRRYDSRALARMPNLAGLAGSSKKRNWEAFNSTYPGTTVNSAGNYVLPAKFAGVVINQGQLDDLAGTWYGATYHPDGDQAGWQQKFDAVLKSIGAYDAFYGRSASPPPTGLIPQPTLQVTPASGQLPSGVTLTQGMGYAPDGSPVYRGSDGRLYLKTGSGFFVYAGPVSATPPGAVSVQPAPVPQPITLPATGNAPSTTVNVPATVAPDQTSALIQQLMAQGASQQQAFNAALQSLAAQGVPATPQVQQQVASDVQAASSPQQASTIYLAIGAVALIGFGILMSGRKKRR